MQNSGIEVLFEGSNFERLLGGLLVTIEISFLSIGIGTLLGIVMGLLRTLGSRPLRFILRLYLETFRIIPILVWLYVVHFSFSPLLHIDISGRLPLYWCSAYGSCGNWRSCSWSFAIYAKTSGGICQGARSEQQSTLSAYFDPAGCTQNAAGND